MQFLVRVALLALVWCTWWWAANPSLPGVIDLPVIVGGVLLVFPLAWLGRKVLDRRQTEGRAVWTTTLVQFGLGFVIGIPLVRALATHRDWPGPVLPVPPAIGAALAILTAAASFLAVVNLASKGFGAPFFIVLSRRLASDWLYARTRNPMLVAGLAFFLCLGIWFQSALFVLWVLLLVTPAMLFFVKVFEERELEIRFGASYLRYKSRTPMLFPRMPRG